MSAALCAGAAAPQLARASHTAKMPASPLLLPVYVDGLWGYIDATGKMVIPPRFEQTHSFTSGLAPTAKKDKWGYIDTHGKWVIEPRYSYAFNFWENGLAEVSMENGNQPAFIDRSGRIKLLLPGGVRYDGFAEGLCSVTYAYSALNDYQTTAGGKSIPLSPDRTWFIDIHGKRAFPGEFDYAWGFAEGLSAVKVKGKYGFIDKTGKFALPLQYDEASFFQEGVACVRLNARDFFIDHSGHVVLPSNWDEAEFFSEGFAAIRIDKKWGYIDKRGGIVIAPAFESAGPFHEGRATCELNGKYGVIDTSGKWVVPPAHTYVGWYDNGIAYYTDVHEDADGSQRGFLDRSGKIIWPARQAPSPAQPR